MTTNEDPGQYLRRRIAAIHALDALLTFNGRELGDDTPSGVRLTVHLCDGSFGQADTGRVHGPHDALVRIDPTTGAASYVPLALIGSGTVSS